MLKNTYVFHQNRSKGSTFDENPCRFLRKTQKSCETIIITIKNVVFECFCFILLWFFVQDHGTTSALPIREPVNQVLAGRIIRDPLQTSCLGKNKDLLFPDVRNRPSDSISFENSLWSPQETCRNLQETFRNLHETFVLQCSGARSQSLLYFNRYYLCWLGTLFRTLSVPNICSEHPETAVFIC